MDNHHPPSYPFACALARNVSNRSLNFLPRSSSAGALARSIFIRHASVPGTALPSAPALSPPSLAIALGSRTHASVASASILLLVASRATRSCPSEDSGLGTRAPSPSPSRRPCSSTAKVEPLDKRFLFSFRSEGGARTESGSSRRFARRAVRKRRRSLTRALMSSRSISTGEADGSVGYGLAWSWRVAGPSACRRGFLAGGEVRGEGCRLRVSGCARGDVGAGGWVSVGGWR